MKRFGAWCFFLVSCSGSSGISIDDMPAKAAKTICTKVYACCMASEVANNGQFGPDALGCEVKLKTAFDGQKNAGTASESKGRATYKGDKVAECLAAYEKLTCEELKKNADAKIAACDAVFEPKVALDGACAQDFECLSGSCRGAGASDGACKAKSGIGSSCMDTACVDDAYCGGNVCRALKSDGEACGAHFECATGGCNGRNPDGGMPNMGTCGQKGGPGTTCYAQEGCSIAGGAPLIVLALAALRRRRRS